MGRRRAQHGNVIDAAGAAGVQAIAYTSLLRADTSPLRLAEEHAETERLLAASGIPHTLLRNGWYWENYTLSLAAVLAGAGVPEPMAQILADSDAQAGRGALDTDSSEGDRRGPARLTPARDPAVDEFAPAPSSRPRCSGGEGE